MGGWDATVRSAGPGTYALASWLFLRLLGLIYLAAFASLALQIRGLVGREGILPVAEFLTGREHWGMTRFWRWPSLCWLSTSDRTLSLLSWGGAALAFLLIVGVAPIPVLALLWIFYLSLFTAGRVFLRYQWDVLLLETGFVAMLVAPPEIVPRFPPTIAPPSLGICLLWWLLFRLMFWSGVVKLRSGDAAWRSLTALNYHYETQPLPTLVSWYANLLPRVFHKCCTAAALVIELLVPFLIAAPPPWRYAAAAVFILFMVLIEFTGNYAFFNLLGIALSLLLVDDAGLLRLCPPLWQTHQLNIVAGSPVQAGLAAVAASLVVVLSLDSAVRLFGFEITWPQPMARFFDLVEPFHLVNSYGLFALMTTWRPEIVLEGSNDGRLWQEYEFKWKPGNPRRRPAFVAPHQPRLDWQMWFAALGAPVSDLWLDRFRARLLQGSPAVIALLKTNPFPDVPPRFVREVLYEYRFTHPAERRATGAWWHRQRRSSQSR
jgi:hypothetical protein